VAAAPPQSNIAAPGTDEETKEVGDIETGNNNNQEPAVPEVDAAG
jgi:hypothetical protein